MPLSLRALSAALAALLVLAGCDLVPGAPGDPDDPDDPDPPQAFDDTPAPLAAREHSTGSVVLRVVNTGYQGAVLGGVVPSFQYGETNGLFEGRLVIGAGGDRIAGRPYGAAEEDWAAGSALERVREVGAFSEGYRTRFGEAAAETDPLGLTVTQWSYSTFDPPADDAVVLVYDVRNDGPPRDALHVGLFADFDLGASPGDDRSGFDAATETVYVYDDTDGPAPFFGLTVIDGPLSGWSTTLRPTNAAFSDEQLYTALTTPGSVPETGGDRRTLLGVGPLSLDTGESARVAFAYVAGEEAGDLLVNAAAARAAYRSAPVAAAD